MAKKAKKKASEQFYPIPDKNPPTATKRLAEINGKPTGQGFGAARKGPSVVG
jgi:hypothetical protein|tara:strand:- start:21 stop:176 length:156 start_codon:yes stop_codon:yes gene_type:complete